MKKLLYIFVLASLIPLWVFSDDEGGDENFSFSNRSSGDSSPASYSNEPYFWSYYPTDTQSVSQGYYTVNTNSNRSPPTYTPPPVPKRLPPYTPPAPPVPKRLPPYTPPPSPQPKRLPPYTPPEAYQSHYHDNDYSYHPVEKHHYISQAEKERRSEKDWYNTHQHGFPPHIVYNDDTGNWECSRWYMPNEKHTLCLEVSVPSHAQYNTSHARGWECNKWYIIDANETSCEVLVVPSNAKLNSQGNGWLCNKWYHLSTDALSCEKTFFPPHASKNIFTGIGWSCDFGYVMQDDYTCKK